MLRPNPRSILGNDLFIAIALDRRIAPAQWLLDRAKTIFERGIVISAATVLAARLHVSKLAALNDVAAAREADDLAFRFEEIIAYFRDSNCILPIEETHISFAFDRLQINIAYERPYDFPSQLNLLDRIVLATAICGIADQPIYLVDFKQSAFERLHQDFNLKALTFDLPPRH